ncbi:MAG: transcriptional regulator [Clostridiales bacterium]|nr:transcriptional regulator [Clostridiales bacterium]
MDTQDKIIELRKATGMNRKVFCEYFKIPYRTVTDWELGNRRCPDYVLRLLEYYIRMNHLDTEIEEE